MERLEKWLGNRVLAWSVSKKWFAGGVEAWRSRVERLEKVALWQGCLWCCHGSVCWTSRSRVERLPKTAAGQICSSAFPSHVLSEIAFSRGASAQNGIAADMPVYVAWYMCVWPFGVVA